MNTVDESSFTYLSNLKVLDTGVGNPELPSREEEEEEEEET